MANILTAIWSMVVKVLVFWQRVSHSIQLMEMGKLTKAEVYELVDVEKANSYLARHPGECSCI
jgi:hypothetical protein